ncbi:unnamed protein product, partial [Staurois parvus]
MCLARPDDGGYHFWWRGGTSSWLPAPSLESWTGAWRHRELNPADAGPQGGPPPWNMSGTEALGPGDTSTNQPQGTVVIEPSVE